MVKQWVREYTHLGISSPRESLILRQYRYDGMLKWGVFDIIGILPVLLQIAVMLFLVGLVDLLWTLHPVVASIVTVLTILTLAMALGTAFMPVFSTNCPYRSPFALFLVSLLTPLSLCCRHWIRFVFVGVPRYLTQNTQRANPSRSLSSAANFLWDYSRSVMKHASASWHVRDIHLVRGVERDLEHRSLLWAHKHIVNDDLLDCITPCIGDLDEAGRVRLAFEVVAQKSMCDVKHVLNYLRCDDTTASYIEPPAYWRPIWDDVHDYDRALLALPARGYVPIDDEREVVRQIHLLIQALSPSGDLPPIVHASQDIISLRDILLLIEALLDLKPATGQHVNRQYCTALLALIHDSPLREGLRFKALAVRCLYTFLQYREPEMNIEGVQGHVLSGSQSDVTGQVFMN